MENQSVPTSKSATTFTKTYWVTILSVVGVTVVIVGSIAYFMSRYWRDRFWVQFFPWQSVAGLLAGEVTLITYLFNRQQLQSQFEEKQIQERTHFEIKALNDRFVDSLNRFANPDSPISRASAALSLADIARTVQPGKSPEGYTPENYPYFLDAASRLARALHMEEDAKVRDAIKEALQFLIEFSRERGEEQEGNVIPRGNQDMLLIPLINKLANANRVAKDAFITSLAACSEIPEDQQALILLLAPLGEDESTLKQVLCDLMKTEKYNTELSVQKTFVEATPEVERPAAIKMLLLKLNCSALQLLDTRDSIVYALLALNNPPLPEHVEELSRWQRKPQLALHDCLLTSVNLSRVKLQGADLRGVHLQGAKLMRAQLERTKLYNANCQEALFNEARLLYAEMRLADLDQTNLTQSIMDPRIRTRKLTKIS